MIIGRGSDDWRSGRFVALDFETTGLDPGRDHVISIGAIPIERGRIRLDQSLNIRVDPGVSPSPASVRIHRIRPTDLVGAAPLAEGADRLGRLLADDSIVVWTAWVEELFLIKTFGGSRRRWSRRLLDVRPLAVRIEERSGVHPSPARTDELTSVAARWSIPSESSHNALADAFVTAQLFVVAASRLERFGRVGHRELRAFSSSLGAGS